MNNVINITTSQDDTLLEKQMLIIYDESLSVPDRLTIILQLMHHALENLLEEEYGDKVEDVIHSLKSAPLGAVMGSFVEMIDSETDDSFNLGPLLAVINKVQVVKILLGNHGIIANDIH